MDLSRTFRNILCDLQHPSVAWCDEFGKVSEVLSGPNIWSLAFERSTELKRLGARPGDRISSPSFGKEFIIDFFASIIGHYVFVPDDSKPRGILQSTNSHALRNKDILLELKTSGSTGEPKTRYYTRQGILLQLKNHSEFFSYQSETERLAILPWGHAFGLVLDLVLGLYSKSVVYCPADQKLRGSRKWMTTMLDTYNIQHLSLVPRQLELILYNNRQTPRAPDSIFIGGARLNHSLAERCKDWIKEGKVYEGYGLTEAGPGVLLNGRAIGCEVKIKDGELFVKSESWSLGDDLKTPCDWQPTNDLCVETDDGRIDVICRASEKIKSSSGQWINLKTLEENLLKDINALNVSIKPTQNGLQVFVFVEFNLSLTKKDCAIERLYQFSGLTCSLYEIVVDDRTENLLENSRGKDLSHFFETQQLMCSKDHCGK